MALRASSPNLRGAISEWTHQDMAENQVLHQSTFVVIGTDRDRKTGALRALLAHNDHTGMNYAGAAFIALAEPCERDQSFLRRSSVSPRHGPHLSRRG